MALQWEIVTKTTIIAIIHTTLSPAPFRSTSWIPTRRLHDFLAAMARFLRRKDALACRRTAPAFEKGRRWNSLRSECDGPVANRREYSQGPKTSGLAHVRARRRWRRGRGGGSKVRLKRWEERALWFQAGRCAVGGSALVRPKHEEGRGAERVSPARSACEPTLRRLRSLVPSFQAMGRTGASKRTLLRSCFVASCVATCDVHLSNGNSLESKASWFRRSLRDSSTATVHLHRISSIDPPSVQGLCTDPAQRKGRPDVVDTFRSTYR